MTAKLLLILLIMTVMGAFAGLFLKRASDSASLSGLLTNGYLYGGGGLYVAAALLNIYVLRFLDYSLVLPLTALTYIWTMLISRHYLHEHISKSKIIGVTSIILGAFILMLS